MFFLDFLFVCLHMLKDFVFSFSHDKLFLLGNTFLSWNVFSFSHSTFMYPPYIFSLFSHMIKTVSSLISFFSTWFLHDFFLKMFFSVNSIMIQNVFSWFFFIFSFSHDKIFLPRNKHLSWQLLLFSTHDTNFYAVFFHFFVTNN